MRTSKHVMRLQANSLMLFVEQRKAADVYALLLLLLLPYSYAV